ncbi:MAG: 4-alpha-L-fucosyltransferase [Elusimicrobiota bacterium]|jgi:hypothetical protein|nr:4-alpha-L-fucosyltransferase [Elusimicrobiota bacterium]
MFKEWIADRKISSRISKHKYIHLMFNDKFNKPFVDFLNKSFNISQHLILCKRFFEDTASPFPVGSNVIELKKLKRLNFDFENIAKIFCHSLFDNEIIEFFDKYPDLLKKSYWVVWGGDLYEAARDNKNDFVRENFKGYLLFAKNDEKVLTKNYRVQNNNFFQIEYPLSIDLHSIAKKNNSASSFLYIQINNSADKSTLEMLDILALYKNENIKIITILSYGQMEYKSQIIEKGNKIFGDKFVYIDAILAPNDYAVHLSNIDILICNQSRQQATANIYMSLYFGAKVFIRSEVSTYEMYKKMGYEIFDTNQIKDMDFLSFSQKLSNNNTKLAKKHTSVEYLKKLWEKVLDA